MWQPLFPDHRAVRLAPTIATSETRAGMVVIGLGNPAEQLSNQAVLLNYKGMADCGSVAQYVAEAQQATWALWQSRLPQGTKDIREIVLEDLSLDTCFGLLLFLARIEGQELPTAKVRNWVGYVTEWERGRYPDRGVPPHESVACLASLLGHAWLGTRDPGAGLRACLEFLGDLFERHDSPHTVVFDHAAPGYRQAMARHVFEEEQCRLAVEHGRRFQLRIPLAGGTERVLTDAILLEEANPSAILKILLRADTEHSFTKHGFSLLGLYRPTERLTGNDMTISVDPDSYLSLSELWDALEERESERWGQDRPKANPRLNLPRYRSADYVGEKYDEPWYANVENTLIAAPKAVMIEGQPVPGSRLDWREDVLPLLWKTYSPIPDMVADSVERLYAGEADDSKRIAIVRWQHDGDLAVASAPTFHAWLAAQSMRGYAVVTPLDLPPPESYEVLRLAGGYAIVHRDGATFLDDWTSTQLDVKGLVEGTALPLGRRLSRLRHLANRLQEAMRRQQDASAGHKFNARLFREWQQGTHDAKVALVELIGIARPLNESLDQAMVRRALERYWGLGDDIEEALHTTERSEQLSREIFAHKRARRDRWFNSLLSGIGLGLVAKETVDLFKDVLTMNTYEWQIVMSKKPTGLAELESIAEAVSLWEWASLIVFVTFVIVGIAGYLFFDAKSGGRD